MNCMRNACTCAADRFYSHFRFFLSFFGNLFVIKFIKLYLYFLAVSLILKFTCYYFGSQRSNASICQNFLLFCSKSVCSNVEFRLCVLKFPPIQSSINIIQQYTIYLQNTFDGFEKCFGTAVCVESSCLCSHSYLKIMILAHTKMETSQERLVKNIFRNGQTIRKLFLLLIRIAKIKKKNHLV